MSTAKAGATFRQAVTRITTADEFKPVVYRQQANTETQAGAYTPYVPPGLPAGAKAPLLGFLPGSGQSRGTRHHAADLPAEGTQDGLQKG